MVKEHKTISKINNFKITILNFLQEILLKLSSFIIIEVAVVYVIYWFIRRKIRVRAPGQTSKQSAKSISRNICR